MKKRLDKKRCRDRNCSNQANITICLCMVVAYLFIADSTIFFFFPSNLSSSSWQQNKLHSECVGVNLGQIMMNATKANFPASVSKTLHFISFFFLPICTPGPLIQEASHRAQLYMTTTACVAVLVIKLECLPCHAVSATVAHINYHIAHPPGNGLDVWLCHSMAISLQFAWRSNTGPRIIVDNWDLFQSRLHFIAN